MFKPQRLFTDQRGEKELRLGALHVGRGREPTSSVGIGIMYIDGLLVKLLLLCLAGQHLPPQRSRSWWRDVVQREWEGMPWIYMPGFFKHKNVSNNLTTSKVSLVLIISYLAKPTRVQNGIFPIRSRPYSRSHRSSMLLSTSGPPKPLLRVAHGMKIDARRHDMRDKTENAIEL